MRARGTRGTIRRSGFAWLAVLLLLPGAPASAEAPSELRGEVEHVFDGDSFVLRAGERRVEVRVFGIDAPEERQPWSNRARNRARELLLGESVKVIVKRSHDGHGRVVGEVRLADRRSLARVLVSEGLAWQYTHYSRDPVIAALEREARSAERGLWSETDPEPPWDYRRED